MKSYTKIFEAIQKGVANVLNVNDNSTINYHKWTMDNDATNDIIKKFQEIAETKDYVKISEFYNMYESPLLRYIPADSLEIRKIIRILSQYAADDDLYKNLNWIDTSKIYSFESLFENSGINWDVSEWNTGNVRTMCKTFCYSSFKGDISNWNTEKVETMESMFFMNTHFNGDISRWDVKNVSSFKSMFNMSAFNGNILDWNVISAIDMSEMFANSTFNQPLYKWADKTGQVRLMKGMFQNSPFDQDITQWDTHSVVDFSEMFYDNTKFMNSKSQFAGMKLNWYFPICTKMEKMFKNTRCTGNILSDWDISNVERLKEMFMGSTFNGDISKWSDESRPLKAITMVGMFRNSRFNGDISGWRIGVEQPLVDNMFKNSPFCQNISDWKIICKAPLSTKIDMLDGSLLINKPEFQPQFIKK